MSTKLTSHAPQRRWRWRPLHHLKARPRVSIAAGVFVLASVGFWLSGMRLAHAVLLGFDLGALVYLGSIWRLFHRALPSHMRAHARALDTGRWGVLSSALVVTAAVAVALGTELHANKGGGVFAIVVAGSTIVLSWIFMNTMFAQHYAQGWYGDFGKDHQGLDFPKTEHPDYWDFMYFALVIGMCFQVSDVSVTTSTLRRTVLLHSVVAFFFNVFIIAMSVNIVAGQS